MTVGVLNPTSIRRPALMVRGTAGVSDPPTQAELDALLGEAALREGFIGAVDDTSASGKAYICVATGGNWRGIVMELGV